jgi:hypothetical protein
LIDLIDFLLFDLKFFVLFIFFFPSFYFVCFFFNEKIVAMINLLKETQVIQDEQMGVAEKEDKELKELEHKSKILMKEHTELVKKGHNQRAGVERMISTARSATMEELQKLVINLEKEEDTYEKILSEEHKARCELNNILRRWRHLALQNQINVLSHSNIFL